MILYECCAGWLWQSGLIKLRHGGASECWSRVDYWTLSFRRCARIAEELEGTTTNGAHRLAMASRGADEWVGRLHIPRFSSP